MDNLEEMDEYLEKKYNFTKLNQDITNMEI